jgi:hypothetical protein
MRRGVFRDFIVFMTMDPHPGPLLGREREADLDAVCL